MVIVVQLPYPIHHLIVHSTVEYVYFLYMQPERKRSRMRLANCANILLVGNITKDHCQWSVVSVSDGGG